MSCLRVIEAGQVAELSDGGDRHRQLHTTEGLERVNHRAEPPGGAPLVEFLGKTLEPVGVLGDCPDLCLEDDWLGWGGTRPTSLSPRRCAGPQVARPVYRISCRSKKAFRRNLAVLRSWSASLHAPD